MKYLFLLLLLVAAACGYSSAQVSNHLDKVGDMPVVHTGDTSLPERVRIRNIIIAGNKKTRDKIITREMSVRIGDTVLRDSLDLLNDQNKKRLWNLSLFTDVTVTAAKANGNEVDIFVLVKEQWYIFPELFFKLADRNFNVWWTEQNRDIRRANLGVVLRHKNFRGNMESLGISAQIGYTQRFGLEYFKPYLDRQQKHGAGASFSFSNNIETYYKTDSNKLRFVRTPPGRHIISQFTAAAVYTYRPRYSSRHLIELRYRNYRIDDTVLELNTEYFANSSNKMKLIELMYQLEYNKVDNWIYPLTGTKFVGHSVSRKGIEGFNFQQYFTAEYSRFNQVSRKWYTAGILRAKTSFPEDQPYIFRNGLGTESEYVRGYEYYVIDGSQYGIARASLKYELLNIRLVNLPLKYLPVIPIRLYPKVFADAGYVRSIRPLNSFLNNRPLYSAGVGLDVVSTYDFKLRLEYTWNHLGEKGLFLHINSE
ncbi:MAG: hypothetical protein EOP56_17235 [Sphingobacteriales bacterium]|nr:MAG: hypothetical protein EOP56_17235 [Sphingobacteriales bacterium]